MFNIVYVRHRWNPKVAGMRKKLQGRLCRVFAARVCVVSVQF